jgi:hypothetical protein
MHNICSGCLLDWKAKNHENCPHCRVKFTGFYKNSTINNVVEKILHKNPEKKNTKGYYEEMDKKAT